MDAPPTRLICCGLRIPADVERNSDMIQRLAGLTLCLAVAGCSSWVARPEAPDGDKCLSLYAQVDARIEAAGVRDAAYYRVPGFPYLRSDRFSASFAHEIPDLDAFWEWVGYLRANEDEARDVELRNLGMSTQDATSLLLDLRGCGGWLRSWELEDAGFREQLIKVVQPPDEYSTAQRAFGVYPLALPFLNHGLAEFRDTVAASYATPLSELPRRGELTLWRAAPAAQLQYPAGTLDLRTRPRDRLGRIGLLGSEVEHLAQVHAPALWIDSAGDHDRPGTPVHGANGPGVDARQPVVYYLAALTRFGGRSLLQFNYFVWFSERLRERPGDGAAGVIDGLIWRVTLDERGQPLFYDTIHACGCYHYGYPVQALQRREDADSGRLLLPQAEVPQGEVALRLESGTHALQRVVAVADAAAEQAGAYALRPYEQLLTLPHPDGGTRSFFGPEGFVAGSERAERLWLWPSGVRNAGAMRQWGRHATAFVGKAHFDDPFLLEDVFVPPQAADAPKPDDATIGQLR